jgi:hypothetical protein
MTANRICFSSLSVFLFVNCLSIQTGNPSLTIFKNQGNLGIYGKLVSPKDQFQSGESCIKSFFGLISFGDASAEAAQSQLHLTEIYSINQSVKTQYFILQEYCTIVYGK